MAGSKPQLASRDPVGHRTEQSATEERKDASSGRPPRVAPGGQDGVLAAEMFYAAGEIRGESRRLHEWCGSLAKRLDALARSIEISSDIAHSPKALPLDR